MHYFHIHSLAGLRKQVSASCCALQRNLTFLVFLFLYILSLEVFIAHYVVTTNSYYAADITDE